MNLICTGGTGSLGKAVLDHEALLKRHGIRRLRVISRDEQKQVALKRAYKGSIPLDCYLGDVADADRMRFALKDAHFVIHAAAQKHIDKFELDIPTGYKINILGTQNVAQGFLHSDQAISGILVSTDKAALPITTYGISKLAAEKTWRWHNTFQNKVHFAVARYGNVFGSRGSVIETWTDQAKKGLPLTITHPDCTRFFMMIEDAARFVIESLFHSSSQLEIPRMKATRMIRLAEVIWKHHQGRKKMKTEFIGLRGIEKMHEILEDGGKDSSQVEPLSLHELKGMYETWLKTNVAL